MLTSHGGLLIVCLALAACTGPPDVAALGEATIPDRLAPLEATPGDAAPGAARKIARHIEREYQRVQVWDVRAAADATVVAFAVRMRLDPRSEHPVYEDWAAHVRRAAGDQRQAAVEMLKLTVRLMPRVRMVSVFQDLFLQPRWTRAQILAMDRPEHYRDFETWQRLVLSAEVLPGVV